MKMAGVIGLGNIGSKAAANLLRAGFDVAGVRPGQERAVYRTGRPVGGIGSGVGSIGRCHHTQPSISGRTREHG
jgi:hypothetical protein